MFGPGDIQKVGLRPTFLAPPGLNVVLGLIKYLRIVTFFSLHRLIKAPRIMYVFLGGVVVVGYFCCYSLLFPF